MNKEKKANVVIVIGFSMGEGCDSELLTNTVLYTVQLARALRGAQCKSL